MKPIKFMNVYDKCVEKKATTSAFKQEQKRQEKIQMNNRVNVQGKRIL